MASITIHHVVSLSVTVLVSVAYMVVAVVILPNQQVTNSDINSMGTPEALRIMSLLLSTIPPFLFSKTT